MEKSIDKQRLHRHSNKVIIKKCTVINKKSERIGERRLKVMKRITSWILIGAMLFGCVFPAQEVNATENTVETEEETTENNTSQIDTDRFVVSELSPATSKVIVLDPGHCKKHSGASANGLREEVVVWDIAKACRDVLNQYGDVTVYMTRESNTCCEALKLGDCLSSRNNYAKQLDADFLISMHINAGASSGANVLAAYKS